MSDDEARAVIEEKNRVVRENWRLRYRLGELEAACRRCEEAADAYLAFSFGTPGAEEILKELAAACRNAGLALARTEATT